MAAVLVSLLWRGTLAFAFLSREHLHCTTENTEERWLFLSGCDISLRALATNHPAWRQPQLL